MQMTKTIFELFEYMTTQGQRVIVDIDESCYRTSGDTFYGAEDFHLKLKDEGNNTEKTISLSELFETDNYFIITMSSQGKLTGFTPIFNDRTEIPQWLKVINDFYGMKLLDDTKKKSLKFWKIRMDELVYVINHPKRK